MLRGVCLLVVVWWCILPYVVGCDCVFAICGCSMVCVYFVFCFFGGGLEFVIVRACMFVLWLFLLSLNLVLVGFVGLGLFWTCGWMVCFYN